MKDLFVFLDLDGVLADFERGVRELCGASPNDLDAAFMWGKIAAADDFYGRLFFTRDGVKLWHFFLHYQPTIITGLPLGDWAWPQKREWCRRELGKVNVIGCASEDKHKYCRGRNSFLIDDRVGNCGDWTRAGGTSILHVSAVQSIATFKELLGKQTRSNNG